MIGYNELAWIPVYVGFLALAVLALVWYGTRKPSINPSETSDSIQGAVPPCWRCREVDAAADAAASSLESPYDSFDARDWARSFVEHVRRDPAIATDEERMVAWFASAIIRGFDEVRRSEFSQTYVDAAADAAASSLEKQEEPCTK
jgi:hypothetical protein